MNYCQLEIKERITISPPPWFALPATIGFPQTICNPSTSNDQTLPFPTTIKWFLIQALIKEFHIPITKSKTSWPCSNEQTIFRPLFRWSCLRRKSAIVPSLPLGIALRDPRVLPLLWNWEPRFSDSSHLWFWFKIGDFKLLALLSGRITYLFVGPVKFLRRGLFGRRSWN